MFCLNFYSFIIFLHRRSARKKTLKGECISQVYRINILHFVLDFLISAIAFPSHSQKKI